MPEIILLVLLEWEGDSSGLERSTSQILPMSTYLYGGMFILHSASIGAELPLPTRACRCHSRGCQVFRFSSRLIDAVSTYSQSRNDLVLRSLKRRSCGVYGASKEGVVFGPCSEKDLGIDPGRATTPPTPLHRSHANIDIDSVGSMSRAGIVYGLPNRNSPAEMNGISLPA